MLYTAAPLVDAILGERYDPSQSAPYRPFAAYWNGWSHPRADYREPGRAESSGSVQTSVLRARLIGVAALAAPLVALAAFAGLV